MPNLDQVRALARFHWASGARVALRANAIIVAAVVFVLGSAPEALATLRAFVLGIVGDGYPVGSRVILAGVCAALAGSAVPRVTLGAKGWMRSLPVHSGAARRAAVAALFFAQLAVGIFVPIAAIGAVRFYHAPLSASKVLGLPVLMLAIGILVLPVRRIARLLALFATLAAIQGSWLAVVASSALVLAADAVGGELIAAPRRRTRRRRSHGTRPMPSATSMWTRASWRAIGVSRALECMIAPLVAVAFAYFMSRNNANFGASSVARVARTCGVIALSTMVSALANALLRTRQPWSWSRSLPWSSSHRVWADAWVLGLPMLAVPIAIAPLDIESAVIVALSIPVVALLGSSALRAGAKRQTGAAGEALVLSLLATLPAALWPPAIVLPLLLVPAVLRWGASRERSVHATRWVELHHDASGDPGWLTSP